MDYSKRAAIVKMLQDNAKHTDIAHTCECSYSTISRIQREERIPARDRGPRHAAFPVAYLRSILVARITFHQSALDEARAELENLPADLLS